MSLEVALLGRERLPELYRFRHSVFFEELGALLSPEQIERGLMTDALDEVAFNYALLDGSDIVGSLRFVDLHRVVARAELVKKYSLEPIIERFGASGIAISGRLALAARYRSGIALIRLIAKGVEDARSRGIKVGVSDCSPYLLPFEERLGYRRYAEPFNDPVYGLKLPILLLGEGVKYLSSVRSPIARVAADFEGDETVEDWFQKTYPQFSAASGQLRPAKDQWERAAEVLGRRRSEQLPFLSGLDPEEVQVLFDGAVSLSVTRGHYLIRKGMKEDHLYLILRGGADAVDATGSVVQRFGAGDIVGESAFLTNSPRSSDVVVRECTECVLIDSRTLSRSDAKRSQLYEKVLRNIAWMLAPRLKAPDESLPRLRPPESVLAAPHLYPGSG